MCFEEWTVEGKQETLEIKKDDPLKTFSPLRKLPLGTTGHQIANSLSQTDLNAAAHKESAVAANMIQNNANTLKKVSGFESNARLRALSTEPLTLD